MARSRNHVNQCIEDARAAIGRSDRLQPSSSNPEIAELRSALRALADAIESLSRRVD